MITDRVIREKWPNPCLRSAGKRLAVELVLQVNDGHSSGSRTIQHALHKALSGDDSYFDPKLWADFNTTREPQNERSGTMSSQRKY